MSNLEKHAEEELRRAGLFDKDSDYGGMLAEAVMKLIRVHAAEGHSEFSHAQTLRIFNRVVNCKTLTPVTDDPAEWCNVSEHGSPDGKPLWQNRRTPSLFSNDGGKTYYDIDEKMRRFSRLRRKLGLPLFKIHRARHPEAGKKGE